MTANRRAFDKWGKNSPIVLILYLHCCFICIYKNVDRHNTKGHFPVRGINTNTASKQEVTENCANFEPYKVTVKNAVHG